MFKLKSTLYYLIFCLNFLSCQKGKNNPEACNGNTRREIKVLIDQSASLLDSNIINSSILELGNLAVSKVKSSTSRLELEKKQYSVYCKVDKVKKERDGDVHIRLKDEFGNYLITEAVNPGCDYAKKSTYYQDYITVKEFLNQNNIEGKWVHITGVAFVDIDHGYSRKQAKNNIELHPILKISF